MRIRKEQRVCREDERVRGKAEGEGKLGVQGS